MKRSANVTPNDLFLKKLFSTLYPNIAKSTNDIRMYMYLSDLIHHSRLNLGFTYIVDPCIPCSILFCIIIIYRDDQLFRFIRHMWLDGTLIC